MSDLPMVCTKSCFDLSGLIIMSSFGENYWI